MTNNESLREQLENIPKTDYTFQGEEFDSTLGRILSDTEFDAILDTILNALPEVPHIPITSLGEKEIGYYKALYEFKAILEKAKVGK